MAFEASREKERSVRALPRRVTNQIKTTRNGDYRSEEERIRLIGSVKECAPRTGCKDTVLDDE